jgi:RNA polymerase sigma-70 factor (ECF subfamily)
MDEADLIRQAKRHNLNAFNELVLLYQDMAYNVAYRIMGEGVSAADATQDAFISAYEKLHTFADETNFKAWLLRIVTNKCYDMLKYNKRRPGSSLDEMTEANESSKWLVGDGAQPEEEQEVGEMVAAVQHCLDALPDDQRIVAILCDVEGYDYNAAAEIAATSLGTIKSRLSRARAKLRDCLRDFAELLPDKYRSVEQ